MANSSQHLSSCPQDHSQPPYSIPWHQHSTHSNSNLMSNSHLLPQHPPSSSRLHHWPPTPPPRPPNPSPPPPDSPHQPPLAPKHPVMYLLAGYFLGGGPEGSPKVWAQEVEGFGVARDPALCLVGRRVSQMEQLLFLVEIRKLWWQSTRHHLSPPHRPQPVLVESHHYLGRSHPGATAAHSRHRGRLRRLRRSPHRSQETWTSRRGRVLDGIGKQRKECLEL